MLEAGIAAEHGVPCTPGETRGAVSPEEFAEAGVAAVGSGFAGLALEVLSLAAPEFACAVAPTLLEAAHGDVPPVAFPLAAEAAEPVASSAGEVPGVTVPGAIPGKLPGEDSVPGVDVPAAMPGSLPPVVVAAAGVSDAAGIALCAGVAAWAGVAVGAAVALPATFGGAG